MIEGVKNPVLPVTTAPTRVGGPPNEESRGQLEELTVAKDAVELSPAAQERIEQGDARPIRLKLVERVRAEIAAGTYLTDEKLNAAVNGVQSELFHAA